MTKLTAEQALHILLTIEANTDFAFTPTLERKLTVALCALDLDAKAPMKETNDE